MADETPVDRISHLPESLISVILSSLPTKEAVATSLLSRTWRFRWTRVTSFNFDNSGEGSKNQIREDEGADAMDFAESVDKVLLNHCGESIQKFLLVWESTNFQPERLTNWANIAIARSVRRLDLMTVNTEHPLVSRSQCEFELPSSLYTSGTLEILNLEGPFRIKPPNVVCLPKLVRINLTAVIYESDESLPVLLSGCPVLYLLAIERNNRRDNLGVCTITSTTLKRLFIIFRDENLNMDALRPSGGGGDLKLKLKINAPALEVLILMDNMSRHISFEPCLVKEVKFFDAPYSSQYMIFEVLQALASVKFLTLHFYAMVEIDRAMELAELEGLMTRGAIQTVAARATLPVFERLTKLVIQRPHWARWSTLMHLLDGCVRLEKLGIWWIESDEHIWSNPARVPKCLSSSLKSIILAGFDSGKEKMSMLKFFLEHGLVMEKVIICCNPQEDRLEMLNKVSQLPKSPACEITCLDYSEACNYINAFED